MLTATPDQIRVLYVGTDLASTDDAPSIRALDAERFSVETATSADEGIEMISDRPPDCVVSDSDLPGTDGLELLGRVRKEAPELPVVLYLGDESEVTASETIAAGATDYVQHRPAASQAELLANRIGTIVHTRREAQRAERQADLRRLAERTGNAGGFEVDIETGDIHLTESASRILDLSAETGDTLAELTHLFHPDDRQEIKQTIEGTVQTGGETRATWRYQHPDGEDRLLDVTVTPDTTGGEATTVRGAVRDITEQREQQQELQAEQQHTEKTLDALDDLLYRLDSDGNLQRWNAQVPAVTGYTESELADMDAVEFVPEDERQTVVEAIETTRSDGNITVEVDLLTADGQHIPYEFTGRRLSDPEGNTTGLVGIGRDLTERKEREKALKRRTQAIDDAPFGICISDPDQEGNPLIYVNDAFVDLTGYSPEEVLGENCRFLQGEHTRPEPVAEMREAIDAEQPVTVELRNYRKNGTEFWNRVEVVPVHDETGDLVNYVGFQQDVTDRKRARQRLEKRERILHELHTATREFYPPDDVSEIAEFLVGFISRSFDLQYVSVKQFDEDESCLRPVDHSSAFAEETQTLGTIEPGSNPLWKAYEQGTPQTLDAEQYPDLLSDVALPVNRGLAVPIGDFGAIVVFRSDAEEIGDVDLDLIEIVAAHAESAFQRLRTAETHSEVTDELSAKQAEVEELTDIVDTIQTLHGSLTESDSRAVLEETVCETLAGTDRIDFAWVGRPQGAETNLKPTTWAGQESGYLNRADPGGGEDLLPAQRAASAHDRCSVPEIASNARDHAWAKKALTAGFRSVLSVPLVHDGVLYGVLSVYASTEGAFDQTYTDLITNVGSLLVTYSVTLETRYEDTSQTYTTLEFDLADPASPFQDLATRTDSRIRFDTVVTAADSKIELCITVLDGDAERVREQATAVSTIIDAEWLGKAENQQLRVTVTKPFLASVVRKHGARLRHAVSDSDGTTCRIELPQKHLKRPVLDALTSEYQDISLEAQQQETRPDVFSTPQVTEILTDRQFEVLRAAFYGGYYDTPKEVTGEDLAASFDISNSAVYKHLQAGQRKILAAIFQAESEY